MTHLRPAILCLLTTGCVSPLTTVELGVTNAFTQVDEATVTFYDTRTVAIDRFDLHFEDDDTIVQEIEPRIWMRKEIVLSLSWKDGDDQCSRKDFWMEKLHKDDTSEIEFRQIDFDDDRVDFDNLCFFTSND